MDDLLYQLYFEPRTGFIGAKALYKKAKALDKSITQKYVLDWYNKQTEIQQHAKQSKKFPEFKIASNNPNSWQIDLAFWERKPIFIAVNINSRIGYAKLLKNKSAPIVRKALDEFITNHKTHSLTSDNGSEWMNKQVQELISKERISHYAGEPGDHTILGKIDRFIRTIKGRLTKMHDTGIFKSLSQKHLNDAIANYNETEHSAIHNTPNEMKGRVILSEIEHNQNIARQVLDKIPIGSTVRYRLKPKTPFEKEGAKWSKSVYEFVGLDGLKMHLRSKNNHVLYRPVNDVKIVQAQTTNVDGKPNDIYEAESILDHEKLKNGNYKYLVRWSDGDETWEPQSNLRIFNKSHMSELENNYFKRARID